MNNKFKSGDRVRCINAGAIDGYVTSELRHGQIYTVDKAFGVSTMCGRYRTTLRGLDGTGFFEDRFELVPDSEPTMDAQIALAKSYIGKKVTNSGNVSFIVQDVGVYVCEKTALDASLSNQEYFNIHGFSVSVMGHGYNSPVMNVKLNIKKDSVCVKLNTEYSAMVYKDKIVVGCQTFPLSILAELSTAHYNLLKDDD